MRFRVTVRFSTLMAVFLLLSPKAEAIECDDKMVIKKLGLESVLDEERHAGAAPFGFEGGPVWCSYQLTFKKCIEDGIKAVSEIVMPSMGLSQRFDDFDLSSQRFQQLFGTDIEIMRLSRKIVIEYHLPSANPSEIEIQKAKTGGGEVSLSEDDLGLMLSLEPYCRVQDMNENELFQFLGRFREN